MEKITRFPPDTLEPGLHVDSQSRVHTAASSFRDSFTSIKQKTLDYAVPIPTSDLSP